MAQLTIPAEFADPALVLAAAVAGNVDALERIVAAHQDDMSRIAFVVCGDAELAQEAVQSAWHIAWRKLGSVRQPDRLRQWLMSVAANEARQLVRKRRGRQLVEIEVADIGTSVGDPSGRAISIDLDAALRRLSADDRAILALRHVGGYDSNEIGRALGMPAASVRTRLARTITRLRSELSDV